jgi:hypothetical protein
MVLRAKIKKTFKTKQKKPPFEDGFSVIKNGAEDETRTRDPDLGKVVLYQLSYFCVVFNQSLSIAVQIYKHLFRITKLFLNFF